MTKILLAGIWLIALLGVFYVVSEKTRTAADRHRLLLGVPALADLDTRIINIATLGHRGLYDDFITIYALQYLSEPEILKQKPADVMRAIRAVSRHQPKIESFYMLSCFVMSMDLQAPEYCEQIALDGMSALPASWRVPVTQGFVFMSLLKDNGKASLYYQMAATKPGAPAYLGSLARKLADRVEATPEDLAATLESLGNIQGGSKLFEFLEEQAQRRNLREERQPENEENGAPP